MVFRPDLSQLLFQIHKVLVCKGFSEGFPGRRIVQRPFSGRSDTASPNPKPIRRPWVLRLILSRFPRHGLQRGW